MRAYVPEYDLVAPSGLNEALKLVADRARPMAGGPDIMVLFEAGQLPYRKLVSLWRIAELRGIVTNQPHVTIGALTTYTEIRQSEIMQREFPLLVKAASWTGAVATQNRGTLAGNIANGSPAADSPPALLAYDAEIELLSINATRWVPYHGFHTGYKSSVMRPGEIIGHIRLPRTTAGCAQYLRKVGTRRAQAIAKVALAGLAKISGGVVERMRIALASVAPTPIRCTGTESILAGRRLDHGAIEEAKQRIGKEIAPISDVRSTQDYRRRVTVNLLGEFLETLLA
jgi:CO/xanthine dehydrogenase FAD-binding subunit